MLQQNIPPFIQTQKQKQSLMKAALIKHLNQSFYDYSGWTIDSVVDHTINIFKYNPLAGSSYAK